jgi:hypothetical protein
MRFDFESTNILNLVPYSFEQSQSSTFLLVVQDRGVARLHLLITILPLSDVMVAAVLLPTVYISILFPTKLEKIRTLGVRLDAKIRSRPIISGLTSIVEPERLCLMPNPQIAVKRQPSLALKSDDAKFAYRRWPPTLMSYRPVPGSPLTRLNDSLRRIPRPH